jgi:hypothetical protein
MNSLFFANRHRKIRTVTILKTNNPRHPRDFYETPYGLIEAALKFLPIKGADHILDPGAGRGRWGRVLRKDPRFKKSYLVGVDIDRDPCEHFYNNWLKKDFLQYYGNADPDLIVGNPPFSLDEEFIKRSFRLLKPGGYMLFLLRQALLEGQDRCEYFWPIYMPEQVITSSRRPSFTNDGGTDNVAYAIYIWHKPRWSWQEMPRYYRGGFFNWDYWPEDLVDKEKRRLRLKKMKEEKLKETT